ncbi:ABC transporter ATP-binding protein [Embleya sp. NPDC005575]|uniref:ABC transporter ATP-binding protein n=1 Tax=Embleya sp. NPDC005575 TaxID=3156892 RepID=UPI0033B90436
MSSAADRLPSSATALFRSLRMGYRASPGLIVVAFVSSVAAAAPDALFAVGLAVLVHGVTTGDDNRVALAVAFVGVLATADWLLNVVSDRANRRFADRAAVVVESHVARLQSSIATTEHHERTDYLDRLSVLRDHAAALSMLYQQLFSGLGALIRLAFTLALLVSVDPMLGLLGVFAVPGVLVSHWRSGVEKTAEEAGARHERRARHLFSLGTSADAGKEIRVAGVQGWLRENYRQSWRRRYVPLARARWTSAAWQSAAQALFGAAFIAGVAYTARGGVSAAGDVTLVLAAGGRLSHYIDHTVTQTQFFRAIWLDVSRRLAWLEDYARAALASADLPAPKRLTNGIRFEGVSFRYPGTERLVLDGVTLDLPAGKAIAIVGENGAGKSTLVKLLCGFYTPSEGRITVDGTDMLRIRTADWRERLTGALQDFFRFEYPAWQSVGVGDLPRSEDRSAVRTAVDRAGAGDVVAKLDYGLDTQLGPTWDQGTDLSHGQWQKIALARGFMRDAPVLLILDEPTSALDAETEHTLFERYSEAAHAPENASIGRITLLVSHRFSTVRMADLIVVLDGARVAEHGTHEELLARGGPYAELYGIQESSYRAGYRTREHPKEDA